MTTTTTTTTTHIQRRGELRLRWALRRGEVRFLPPLPGETARLADESGREICCGVSPWSPPGDDGWVEYDCPRTCDLASEATRGSYQRDLLAGSESLSGSTLAGRSREYSGRYAQSRTALLARVVALGLDVSERVGPHQRRILVITRAV